jgi:hypothetical protein
MERKIIVERRCSKCNELRKDGKEIDGKFICNFCLFNIRTPPTGKYGKFERSYLKVSPRG